jgi:hypothetical protein
MGQQPLVSPGSPRNGSIRAGGPTIASLESSILDTTTLRASGPARALDRISPPYVNPRSSLLDGAVALDALRQSKKESGHDPQRFERQLDTGGERRTLSASAGAPRTTTKMRYGTRQRD